jgi:soluble lytic murein transglycosylase
MQSLAKDVVSFVIVFALTSCAAETRVLEPEISSLPAGAASNAERFAQAYRLLRAGNDEPALAAFTALLQGYPQLADYHLYFIGVIQARRGASEAAEAALTRLLAEYPQSVKSSAAALELGQMLLRQGRYEEATTFLERAMMSPDRRVADPAQLALAEVQEKRGDIAGAYAALMSVRREARHKAIGREAKRAVLALRARHPEMSPQGVELFKEAQLLLDERDYAGAEAAAARLRREPPAGVASAALARLEAETLLGRGRLEDGLAALWRVADEYPRSAEAPAALYRLASLLWNRDRDAAAMRGFDELRRRYPGDRRIPDALYATARIHQSGGRQAEAIAAYEEVIDTYPRNELAAECKWRIGWMHYTAARWEEAAQEFAELAESTSGKRHDEAMYWRARSNEKAGSADRARQLYRQIVADNDGSPYAAYYAGWAESRLAGKGAPTTPFGYRRGQSIAAPSPPQPVAPPGLPAFHLDRWVELHAAGVDDLARDELAAIEREGSGDPATLRFLVEAYQAADGFHRARALAGQLGDGTAARPELLYPLAFWEAIRVESEEQQLDPLWVVSIMRQESMFDPDARSPADARGLMQLLPSTAERMASATRVEYGGENDLYQPRLNIRLGAVYLRMLIDRFGEPLKAVAAYNGGEAAVDRWQQQFGGRAADEFVESITYRETRDYVKRVAGNYRVYRKIYVEP